MQRNKDNIFPPYLSAPNNNETKLELNIKLNDTIKTEKTLKAA